MESNFHSTVLQRPPSLHDYEDQQRDRDRERERERERGSSERRHRDILNPVQHGDNTNPPPGSSSHAPGQQQQQQHSHQPPPRHSFSLRSPTQPDFHHAAPPHFPGSSSASPSSAPSASAAANTNASTSTSTNGTGSGTRSLLHNPFLTSSSAAPPSLPPPVHPSSIAPPRSPLHAPPVFYPQDMREHRDAPREKTAGSFYDPTTDTTTSTSDRRVSDSGSAWHNATQASSASSASKVSKISPQGTRQSHQAINQSWMHQCSLLVACCWYAGGRQHFFLFDGCQCVRHTPDQRPSKPRHVGESDQKQCHWAKWPIHCITRLSHRQIIQIRQSLPSSRKKSQSQSYKPPSFTVFDVVIHQPSSSLSTCTPNRIPTLYLHHPQAFANQSYSALCSLAMH